MSTKHGGRGGKKEEKGIMSWWVTGVAVTVKVAAEHGVSFGGAAATGLGRSSRGADGLSSVLPPSGEDTIQSLTAPLLGSSELSRGHNFEGTPTT